MSHQGETSRNKYLYGLYAAFVLTFLSGPASAAAKTFSLRIDAAAPSTANDLHFRWTAAADGISKVPFDVAQEVDFFTSKDFQVMNSGEGRLDFDAPSTSAFQAGDKLTILFNVLADEMSPPTMTSAFWTFTAGNQTLNLTGTFVINGMITLTGGQSLPPVAFAEGRWQDLYPDLADPVPLPGAAGFFLVAGAMLHRIRRKKMFKAIF